MRERSTSVQIASAFKTSTDSLEIKRIDTHTAQFSDGILPGRGHDCVYSPKGDRLVAFARRPGTWFIVFNERSGKPEFEVQAQSGRHFYGHGRFSVDGRLLFTTENDYDNARGMIGIYDVSDSFRRVGEYPSGGIGPHDLAMSPDSKTLIVANGGIETHPEFEREKLNLATMQSSLDYINVATGQISNTYKLPVSLQRLSIRHLALSANGDCFFAGQYQGAVEDAPALVGCCRRNGEFQLWDSAQASRLLHNYVTSIAVDLSGTTVVTTSARGSVVIFWNAYSGSIKSVQHLPDCSGVATDSYSVYVTSSSGLHRYFLDGDTPAVASQISVPAGSWDNHLAIRSH